MNYIIGRPNCGQQCDAVIERYDGLLEKHKVLTANCVQTVFGNIVSVRFANFNREIRTVQSGINVA